MLPAPGRILVIGLVLGAMLGAAGCSGGLGELVLGDWLPAPGERSGSAPAPRARRGASGRPRFLINQVLSPRLERLAAERGAERAVIIYQWTMDPQRTRTIDLTMLGKWMDANVPRTFDGYGILDIELPYTGDLWKGPRDPNFARSSTQMLKALRYAKRVRPAAKWSLWGVPPFRYGSYDAATMTLATAPSELIAEMDFLAVSIYDRHRDDNRADRPAREKRHFTRIIEMTREIAGADREVFGYVWHRYSHTTMERKRPNLELVPAEELTKDILWALDAGADGIIWWGADEYYAKLLRDPPKRDSKMYELYRKVKEVYAGEKPPSKSLERHHDEIHERTINLFAEVLERWYRRRGGGADEP